MFGELIHVRLWQFRSVYCEKYMQQKFSLTGLMILCIPLVVISTVTGSKAS